MRFMGIASFWQGVCDPPDGVKASSNMLLVRPCSIGRFHLFLWSAAVVVTAIDYLPIAEEGRPRTSRAHGPVVAACNPNS